MKEKFKLWLISLNCDLINDLGVDEIVSRVDDKLEVVAANKEERVVLEEVEKKNKKKKKTPPLRGGFLL